VRAGGLGQHSDDRKLPYAKADPIVKTKTTVGHDRFWNAIQVLKPIQKTVDKSFQEGVQELYSKFEFNSNYESI
jgi:hypothetical protein